MSVEMQSAGQPGQSAAFGSAISPTAARAASAAGGRNVALDFTKGALVVFMVIYHSLNYFYHDRNVLRYLHFLPPSFIFITGFLITNIYLGKYDLRDSRLHRRLVVRGIKLLAIFAGLNLAVNAVFKSNYNQSQMGLENFLSNAWSIFLTGDGRISVFEVLLPISYLLILSGLLLLGSVFFRRLLPVVAAGSLLVCLILAWQDRLAFNAELLSLGLLGLVAGFIPLQRIDSVARHLALLLGLSVAYTVLITYRYPVYTLNMLGVGLTLLLLYGIGLAVGEQGPIQKRVAMLGRYSLLAYIVQIAVLQALFRITRGFPEGMKLLFGFSAALILTVGIIELVDILRPKWPLANRFYKAVFA